MYHNDDVVWKVPETSENKNHADYQTNLNQAEAFCKNVSKSLLKGMSAKITDGQHLKKALLSIGFSPPKNSPLGNFSTPISLHQVNREFNRQTESTFNVYMQTAKKFWDKQPKEVQGTLLNDLGNDKDDKGV